MLSEITDKSLMPGTINTLTKFNLIVTEAYSEASSIVQELLSIYFDPNWWLLSYIDVNRTFVCGFISAIIYNQIS